MRRVPTVYALAAPLLAAFALATAARAAAIEVPLSPETAKTALDAGSKIRGVNVLTLSAFREWIVRPDPDPLVPPALAMTVQTPFFSLFTVAAFAAGRGEPINDDSVQSVLTRTAIVLSAATFSDGVADNDSATMAVRQGDKVVEATRTVVQPTGHTDIFFQSVLSTFEISSIDWTKPFTIILTRIAMHRPGQAAIHEAHFTVDPSKMR
jgi:hypothetical protein